MQVHAAAFSPSDLRLRPPVRRLQLYTYSSRDATGLQELTGCSTTAESDEAQQLEARVISAFERSPYATRAAAGADFFFVPARPACLTAAGASRDALAKQYRAVIEQLPHFQVTGGRDHIFLFTTPAGPYEFADWCATRWRTLSSVHGTPSGRNKHAVDRVQVSLHPQRDLPAARNRWDGRAHGPLPGTADATFPALQGHPHPLGCCRGRWPRHSAHSLGIVAPARAVVAPCGASTGVRSHASAAGKT